jgi:hypothetical protein
MRVGATFVGIVGLVSVSERSRRADMRPLVAGNAGALARIERAARTGISPTVREGSELVDY